MNIVSSILKWIGNTIGANPNTLTTTAKTLVGAINELKSGLTSLTNNYNSSIGGLRIIRGYIASGTGGDVPANGYKDFTVTFSPAFKSTALLVASVNVNSTAATYGYITVGTTQVTKNGATIRVWNKDTSDRAPGINWIAVGDV